MKKTVLLVLVTLVAAGLLAGAVSATNYHPIKKHDKNKHVNLQTQTSTNTNTNTLTNTNTNTATSSSTATNNVCISNYNTFEPKIILKNENKIGKITVTSTNFNVQEQIV